MLRAEILDEHLRRHYGFEGELALEAVATGRASNHKVSSKGQCWLFKVFQPEYAPARFPPAADFVSYLAASGYPVQTFVPAKTGTSVTVLKGRAAVLIPWVDGDTPAPNTVTSPDVLHQLGALCGRVHRLGTAYPDADRLRAAKQAQPRPITDRRAALVELATTTKDAAIADELGVRIAILDRLGPQLAASAQAVRDGVIHGDFFCTHVVFREHRAVAVIDVLGERYQPGWEMMRGFFQSVPSVFEVSQFDGPWQVYLAGYADACPIRSEDVAVAYDTYLLQLASSRYGLQSPLDDTLRAFGRWRTHTAQYLAAHRADLRSMMAARAD